MDLRIFYDSNGYPRVEATKRYEIIGWYLEQDLQSSISDCEEMINICQNIINGTIKSWKGTGNAHTVVIDRSTVTIINEFSEPEAICIIPIQKFQIAVKEWMKFISHA